MTIDEHVASLHAEAVAGNERRMLVVEDADRASSGFLKDTLADIETDLSSWVCLGDTPGPWSTISPGNARQLLGRTIPGLIIDGTDSLRANTIGQSVGAVAGGGLIVLLIGAETEWSIGPLASDERLAVPPYTIEDVTNHFRRRFMLTLHQHRGVSIVDGTTGALRSDGTMGPPTQRAYCPATFAGEYPLEADLREACVSDDQQRSVHALRDLEGSGVVVIESHRGRGKSAAAGIAAAGFARDGERIIVTGPDRGAVREVFERAAAVLDTIVEQRDRSLQVRASTGDGSIIFRRSGDLASSLDESDILIVDEAAAIPVDQLRRTLEADLPVAYLTTTHGYEGTGRGFSVRFSEHLDRSDRPIRRLTLEEPIRYAIGDPIETWQFRALMLDATPAPDIAVDTADPASVEYARIDRSTLVDDEALLRELFGLLVLAHYRTEPDDLQRLLDAPNISIRALLYDGHPVSVAMLAEEGGLDTSWCDRLYAGESIRGHMIPDLLTTQLRDRTAGTLRGLRVLRIATHASVRSDGLGSQLMELVHEEFGDDVDWFGASFGATTRLLSFWDGVEYRLVHIGTSRNPRSGEHSAVLLRGTSPDGDQLIQRHEQRLIDRLPGQLPDTLDTIDPAIIATAIQTIGPPIEVELSEWELDAIEAAANGPGQVATIPTAFSQLTIAGLNAGAGDTLSDTQRHLLVRRTLQATPLWVGADDLDLYIGDARNELTTAIETLLTWYRSHHLSDD